ncbi:MAG: helix-hairpin-helix domain-containing protein [archaeon]
MKRILLFVVIILVISNVYAVCSENQIDINSAQLEELDKLTGIGPVKAQSIIDAREFNSVDDLILVYGIGEKTLQKIKDQGLACVEGNIDEVAEEIPQEEEPDIEIKEIKKAEDASEKEIKKEIEIINLNAKNIKTEEDAKLEEPDKKDYLIYGFIGFCLLIGFLFVIQRLRYKKSEFN